MDIPLGTMVGLIGGLLVFLFLLLYLTYTAPGRNPRGNWRLRMVGVAAGLAMMGTGVFLTNHGELPGDVTATVGLFMVGPGMVIAFFSLVLTSPQEPQESRA